MMGARPRQWRHATCNTASILGPVLHTSQPLDFQDSQWLSASTEHRHTDGEGARRRFRCSFDTRPFAGGHGRETVVFLEY
jgi:hypothetical protein